MKSQNEASNRTSVILLGLHGTFPSLNQAFQIFQQARREPEILVDSMDTIGWHSWPIWLAFCWWMGWSSDALDHGCEISDVTSSTLMTCSSWWNLVNATECLRSCSDKFLHPKVGGIPSKSRWNTDHSDGLKIDPLILRDRLEEIPEAGSRYACCCNNHGIAIHQPTTIFAISPGIFNSPCCRMCWTKRYQVYQVALEATAPIIPTIRYVSMSYVYAAFMTLSKTYKSLNCSTPRKLTSCAWNE